MSKKAHPGSIILVDDIFGVGLLSTYTKSASKARKADFFDNTEAQRSWCTFCKKYKEPEEFWTKKICRLCYRILHQ